MACVVFRRGVVCCEGCIEGMDIFSVLMRLYFRVEDYNY